MVGLLFWSLVIKIPGVIRASNEAISASDTAPEILHHNPIFPAISCLGWTNGYTGSLFTVHTRHGQKLNSGMGIFALTHRQYLIPINLPPLSLFSRRAMRNVILLPAGYGTGLTGDAFIQIDDHTPFGHVNPQAL
jgi:hypothetical protein